MWSCVETWVILAPIGQQVVVQSGSMGEPAFWTAFPWFAWVAIAGIVSGSLTGIISSYFKHRERMEMIRHGLNPDDPTAKATQPEL